MWPFPPAPVTLCTNHCAQEIAESIIKALAPACPDARHRGLGAALPHRDQGRQSAHGRPFIWHLFHARPGGGASPVGDGWETAGRRAGGGRHQVRQRRGRRGALPAVLRAPRVPARTRSATGATGAARARSSSSTWRSKEPARGQHRGRRHPPCARTASSAARTACRIATACSRTGGATACSRRRRSASPSGRATSSSSSRPAAAATGPRQRPAEARAYDRRQRLRDRAGPAAPANGRAPRGAAKTRRAPPGRAADMYRIGIDIGGTFTDLAAVDDAGRVDLAKAASTPQDPSARPHGGPQRPRRRAGHRSRRAPRARPSASCTARPWRPTRCSSARARASGS